MDYTEVLKSNLTTSINAKKLFLEKEDHLIEFSNAVDAVVNAYKKGGRIYIAGNGCSAADAQHLAAEFICKLAKDRGPLPAEALTVDSSVITAIGNDYGYDEIFARQILGKMRPHDIFFGITTSGKSQYIIRAQEICKSLNIPSIVFTGHDGGKAEQIAEYCILVTGEETATIQELHIVLAHSLCQCVEAEIFN
jgi:D-sedoheptulose 7-phosphate isomerase